MKTNKLMTTILLLLVNACNSGGSPQCKGDYFISGAGAQKQLAALSGCTSISGNFTVRNTDVRDLNALSSLRSIAGNLWIDNNDSLMTLHGLNALLSVGGELSLSGNHSLTTIEGLHSLTSIGQDLWLFDNPRLTSPDGLVSLRVVGGQVSIRDNGFPATIKAVFPANIHQPRSTSGREPKTAVRSVVGKNS